jgi:PAS domain S-box-containing protein
MKTPTAESKNRALEQMKRELESQIAERDALLESLRRSEERFRLLVQGVKDCAIYLLSIDGVVTTWNSGAEHIKGYRAEEIIGKSFACFYRPEDILIGKPKRSLELAAAQGQFEDENLRVRKDGSTFWASVLITALYDPSGQLYGFAKVVRDVTARKETEQKLRDAERLALLGTTAAVFAHEIGNPLNALSTSLQMVRELVRDLDCDSLVNETLDVSHHEIQRLTALLNDYRSFARPHIIKIEPSDIRQVFDEVLAPVTRHYQEAGVTIERLFDENLSLVPMDRQKIKQVLLNLCKNAVEAMPKGGILTCKAYQSDGRLILEVSDTGTGIPDGLDVFQLFKTSKPNGTGLGLSIVEQIVSEHSGTVDYVTELGRGTAFRISLPLPLE